ncbi:MAG TPA: ClpXP protease specificity-enhancing factor [Gammaproteobacteria bacterium]|nr:ClpXP protease specificity-enhancing factor [Gammaproteobacteria bacterium]
MLSRKPYLLRAMHQWIVDSGHTPHIVVDVNVAGVEVPPGYAKDGKLVLNVSYEATQKLELVSEYVEFSARFGGVSRLAHVPMDAVLAIYAHETGQGMIFEPKDEPAPAGSPSPTAGASKSGKSDIKKKPSLKVVK